MLGISEKKGFDTFLRLTKDYESGVSIGYNFSRERYETPELVTYLKQGQIYQKNRLVTQIGFFHTIHIGYLFWSDFELNK